MTIESYSKLAGIYDSGEWGGFSLQYAGFVKDLSGQFDFVPNKILDISCGTGSLVGELSKDYDVAGSDISASMIEVARKKHPECTFYVSDMAKLDVVAERFDLVLSPFDSVNYLIDPDHLSRAFANVHRLLVPAGHFLFDFNCDRLYEEKHRGCYERESGDVRFTQTCEYDKEKRIAKTIFEFGEEGTEVHIQRAYGLPEIDELLKKTGFHIQYALDMFTGTLADDSPYKVLVLAVKEH